MIDLLASLFGSIIRLIYNAVGQNYGLSIILFTVLTKVILFPINLKQARAMKDMQKLVPIEKEIREKYKGNKDKQAEELAKAYQEHKINPLSGCLPLLIQFPIILAMFAIVRQPLTYIAQVPQETVIEYAKEISQKDDITEKEAKNMEISIASKKNILDMNFLKMNFGDVPSDSLNKELEERPSKWILLVPVLSVALQALQIVITQRKSQLTDEQKEQQKSMNIMMPVLSGVIAYTMPLALGIYWLLGNILGIISQLIIDEMVKDKSILLKEKN